jgi:hypothetical protein
MMTIMIKSRQFHLSQPLLNLLQVLGGKVALGYKVRGLG